MKKNSYHWRSLEAKEIFKTKYFTLQVDKCELPDGRVMPRYYSIDFPDWVQVVALDQNQKFILVNQYRFPVDDMFIEFPGGSSDPNRLEDHLIAAQRELKEETGYVSSNWQYVGAHHPNPALMKNKCHVYIARDCEKVVDQQLDPFEILEVLICSYDQLKSMLVQSNNIHSLMLATFALADFHLKFKS